MDKRYQVFVSSTYEDLRLERQEVMHALLELDCMPAGMELFPAASEDQWSLIRKVIDESDYYLVVSAGRYGSLGPQGQSYTEMEYRYAITTGKPVLAFLHKDPMTLAAGVVEATDGGKAKLATFRQLLQQKVCKYWSTPADLGSVVSRSLVRLTRTTPGVGWIRADQAVDAVAAGEILRLRKTIDDLELKLREARLAAPTGTDRLAQAEDEYSVDFTFEVDDPEGEEWTWNASTKVSWDDILYDIGPLLINESKDVAIKRALAQMVQNRSAEERESDTSLTGYNGARAFTVSDHDYATIMIQLRALGMIAKSTKQRSVKDTATYWTLTPYGDQYLTTLRAILRTPPQTIAVLGPEAGSKAAQPEIT